MFRRLSSEAITARNGRVDGIDTTVKTTRETIIHAPPKAQHEDGENQEYPILLWTVMSRVVAPWVYERMGQSGMSSTPERISSLLKCVCEIFLETRLGTIP
jgi:hypothetical protein